MHKVLETLVLPDCCCIVVLVNFDDGTFYHESAIIVKSLQKLLVRLFSLGLTEVCINRSLRHFVCFQLVDISLIKAEFIIYLRLIRTEVAHLDIGVLVVLQDHFLEPVLVVIYFFIAFARETQFGFQHNFLEDPSQAAKQLLLLDFERPGWNFAGRAHGPHPHDNLPVRIELKLVICLQFLASKRDLVAQIVNIQQEEAPDRVFVFYFLNREENAGSN